jgi:hypothetical protein
MEFMSYYIRRRDGNGPDGGKLLEEPYRKMYCKECRTSTPAFKKYYAAKHPTSRGRIRKYGHPQCVKGHVKTPWTWREYGGHLRCMTCFRINYDKAKQKAKMKTLEQAS